MHKRIDKLGIRTTQLIDHFWINIQTIAISLGNNDRTREDKIKSRKKLGIETK